MTTAREVRDWLGDFAASTSDEQVEQIAAALDVIAARWPDPDEADTREAALSGAAQVALGDDTLEGIAAAWSRARAAEREAMAALTGALLASSTGARSGRGSETDLIARSGVARMTVRKALGR